MTGVTLQLAPWQIHELRLYRDANLLGVMRRTPVSPNLARRGLIDRVGKSTGVEIYQITPLGRAALAEYEKDET